MKYKTINNFLVIDFFKEIKNLVMDREFPWRKRDHMVTNTNDSMFFTYSFYHHMAPSSDLYTLYIVPILKKLQAKAPIQIRANLSISALFKVSSWHRDHEFPCTTAILYLNDCDGGTDLQLNNKIVFIKAEANKMLIFDTEVLHRAVTSKKEPVRYVINFNYFTK